MSRSNLRLNIAFDFELQAPQELLEVDHESLSKALHEALGAMVLQGMPTVTAKQLGKAGISVVSHRHHIDVANMQAVAVPREALVAAAPHLTDEELSRVANRVRGKLPLEAAEQIRVLRRHALALVGDFRMLACTVDAHLVSGSEARLEGRLNLTNGSIVLAEGDRQKRIQPRQPIRVELGDPAIFLPAQCAGNTLSGPVLEVALPDLAAHRDTLIGLWQTVAA